MDKFKELQEQHQQSPKEANPFLTGSMPSDFGTEAEDPETNEKERGIVIVEPDQSPVLPQTLEPEVVDNLSESLPSEDEGQE